MRKRLLKLVLGLPALLGAFVALSGLAGAEGVLPVDARTNANSTTTKVEVKTPQVTTETSRTESSTIKKSTSQAESDGQITNEKDTVGKPAEENDQNLNGQTNQSVDQPTNVATAQDEHDEALRTALNQSEPVSAGQDQALPQSGPVLTSLNHSLQTSVAERPVQSVASRTDQTPVEAANADQPAPYNPQPIQNSGLFDKLSIALATSVLPTANHFFLDITSSTNPINYSLPLGGLAFLVLVAVILDLFLCWLRKSGYHGAARSDGLPSGLLFATPIKVSFSWASPSRDSLFSGLKTNTSSSLRKGGE